MSQRHVSASAEAVRWQLKSKAKSLQAPSTGQTAAALELPALEVVGDGASDWVALDAGEQQMGCNSPCSRLTVF